MIDQLSIESSIQQSHVIKPDNILCVITGSQLSCRVEKLKSCEVDLHLPFRELLINYLLMEKPARALFVCSVRFLIHVHRTDEVEPAKGKV